VKGERKGWEIRGAHNPWEEKKMEIPKKRVLFKEIASGRVKSKLGQRSKSFLL